VSSVFSTLCCNYSRFSVLHNFHAIGALKLKRNDSSDFGGGRMLIKGNSLVLVRHSLSVLICSGSLKSRDLL
jgi:hypothetical protein